MSGLYLEEGETFVVTTHRISVGFVQYDVMLTSKNLILLDSSHTTINPQKIPLSTVLAVNAGKTATGEPVITLTFIKKEDVDTSLPMNLLFSQNAGEERRAERDEWVKRLMEQVVALQQGSLLSQPARGEEGTGISARASAPMRGIDMPLPHKSIIREEPVLVDLRVVPEERPQIPEELVQEKVAGSGLPENYEEREARGEEGPFSSQEIEHPADTGIPEHRISMKGMKKPGEEIAGASLVEESEAVPGGKAQASRGEYPRVPAAVPEISRPGSAEPSSESAPQKEEQKPSAEPEPVPVPETVTPHLIMEAMQGPEKVPDQQAGPEPVPDVGIVTTEISLPGPAEPGSKGEHELVQKTGQTTLPVSWPATSPEISTEILDEITRDTDSGETRYPQKDAILGKGSGEEDRGLKAPSQFPSLRTLAAVALIIIILLAIAGWVIYSNRFISGSTTVTPPSEGGVTNVTVSPTVPVQTPVTIPQEGIWLLLNGSYSGDYGRPGNLIPVAGSGQQLYRIRGSPPLIQVIFRNQDTTGNLLLVEMYTNGTRVLSRSTSVPGGLIEFIVDPKTGEFPRATPTPTSWTGLSPGVTYRT